jgi:hypothetical protein
MPGFFNQDSIKLAGGFVAGVASNMLMTEVFAIRNSRGNISTDAEQRQMTAATFAFLLMLHGVQDRKPEQAAFAAGILFAVFARIVTGCNNLLSDCGEASPFPPVHSM